MPRGRCSVDGCDQFDDRNIRLVYRLPSIPPSVKRGIPTSVAKLRLKRRNMWLKALKRDEVAAGEEIEICSTHFVKGKPAPLGLPNDVDWAPILLMPGLSSSSNAGSNSPVVNYQDRIAANGSENACIVPKSSPHKPENLMSHRATMPHRISFHNTNDVVENPGRILTCDLNTSEPVLCSDNASENQEGVQANTGSQITRPSRSTDSVIVDGGAECSSINQRGAECGESDESSSGIQQDWMRKYQQLLAENQQLLEDNRKLQLEKEKVEKKAEEMENLRENFLRDQKLASEKITELQDSMNKLQIGHAAFKGDDKKIKYMTGLPNYDVLMLMFKHVEDDIRVNHVSVLNKFQQFVLTLMRLRLDLEFVLLAFMFRVSPQTVSRTFYSVIDIMYVRYSFLVSWPSRESQYASMPLIFKESFGDKVAVIVDCFEIRMDRPSNIHAAAQVYSIYKKSPTVKILIGVSPQGAVIFISEGYGGRASDKFMTESCGILDHLRPGDIILADRGFTVHELVRSQQAVMHMPGFKERKMNQLQPKAVEDSRRISNLRIHVERVIGVLRGRFKILSSTLPIEFFHGDPGSVPVIDKIVKVCCALSNVCPTVVPTI